MPAAIPIDLFVQMMAPEHCVHPATGERAYGSSNAVLVEKRKEVIPKLLQVLGMTNPPQNPEEPPSSEISSSLQKLEVCLQGKQGELKDPQELRYPDTFVQVEEEEEEEEVPPVITQPVTPSIVDRVEGLHLNQQQQEWQEALIRNLNPRDERRIHLLYSVYKND
jgi:hypothetical protein